MFKISRYKFDIIKIIVKDWLVIEVEGYKVESKIQD